MKTPCIKGYVRHKRDSMQTGLFRGWLGLIDRMVGQPLPGNWGKVLGLHCVIRLYAYGKRGEISVILGHEGAGIVGSVGRGTIGAKERDHGIMLERACKTCKLSDKTNLCMKTSETRARGTMPDGQQDWGKMEGKLSFYGCIDFFSIYSNSDISLVVISREAPLNKICLPGCASRSAKIEPVSTIAVFGAVASGAIKIVPIDINSDKELWARKLVADTDCEFVNSLKLDVSIRDYLIEISNGGFDYIYDCTGNVYVMEQALEVSVKGWGKLCIIGSSLEAFGGIKGRSEIPQLVELYMKGQLKLDEYITHKKNIKNYQ
ncbi:hypothetical protein MERGE_001644 [Pneumocystis wakefieldiae]|uniref:Alcohol dehydrogenase-like C-terminal domain-containing protein n=1 Tax=Pneumocystis wakefieldiae TaxID=38082 RepID=A0A899FVJ4_9ASCO|nr:hypothetical protein MERGE_001644 [Pneumocystis wakefieldiae]